MALKSVFFATKNMSSRRHPLRVLFNSDADELGTHGMYQCFISSFSYSEVQTELSFENYGARRKNPRGGGAFKRRGLQPFTPLFVWLSTQAVKAVVKASLTAYRIVKAYSHVKRWAAGWIRVSHTLLVRPP